MRLNKTQSYVVLTIIFILIAAFAFWGFSSSYRHHKNAVTKGDMIEIMWSTDYMMHNSHKSDMQYAKVITQDSPYYGRLFYINVPRGFCHPNGSISRGYVYDNYFVLETEVDEPFNASLVK